MRTVWFAVLAAVVLCGCSDRCAEPNARRIRLEERVKTLEAGLAVLERDKVELGERLEAAQAAASDALAEAAACARDRSPTVVHPDLERQCADRERRIKIFDEIEAKCRRSADPPACEAKEREKRGVE
jgi:outer membrane murein-binding lipoprotein Lpp